MIDIVNDGVILLKDAVAYLQQNGWYILILLVSGYYVKTNYVDSYLENRNYRPEPERKANYEADMRRVRLEQQERARERALEAAKLRAAKEEEEKKRKNTGALPSSHKKGTRLGKPSDNSFNPLQPWSSSSSGGGYKPAKRTVRRS